jgi:acetolactate synthase-1/2/3 large subunit
VKHEQAAAHAADAYARVSGKVGVCFATSGPGATNIVTGIANAWMDSVPMVCVTGQVITALLGRDGFQEADIPRDVLQQKAPFIWPEKIELRGYRPRLYPDKEEVAKAAQLIAEARRPVILSGHGVIISQAYHEVRELAEKANVPVITTLLGISGFPGTHPLYLGMPGMHGMYWNNIAIQESDLIIGVGMRFDDRVTGRLKDFAPNAKIVHIEIDPAEIGKNVRPAATLQGDARTCLRELNKQVQHVERPDWFARLDELKRAHPSITIRETPDVLPQYVIQKLYEATGGDCYIVTGVGQHQMWAAQYFWYDKPNSFVTSGGLGTMGFEVPAAMGVQAAKPGELVWSVCGDGGFQMTMQELATIAEYGWPIKFAIINNSYLGMVRQWQELFYRNNVVATPMANPDFVKLAEAFGILGLRAARKEDVGPVIQQAIAHAGPVVCDFQVKEDENVFPMVPAGAALEETIDLPVFEDERVGVRA